MIGASLRAVLYKKPLALASLIFIISLTLTSASSIITRTTLVTKLTPSTYGQQVTFVASVSGGVPNGEAVSFFDSGALIGNVLTSSGSASFVTSTLSGGTHYITASYFGDLTFKNSTSSIITQTVEPAVSSISLSVSPKTSTYGQPVNMSAVVIGNYLNGEIVNFYDSGSPLGTGRIASGSATFATSLSTGTHLISAIYSGDSNNTRSVSNTITQTTKVAPTSISLSSSTSGATTTVSAVVSSSFSVVPNGETVTFYDNSLVIGTGKITAGVATFASISLSVGSHSVTATYGGDPNFAWSTSSSLTLPLANNKPSCTLWVNATSGSQYYVAPQQIAIYYSIRASNSCSVHSVSGTLTLSDLGTGEVYYSAPINLSNIRNASVTRVTYANSTGAPEGANLAILLLTLGQTSNISSTAFYVLQNANIKITDLSVVTNNNTKVGSPISLLTHILNNASFSASNATLNLKIVAPDLTAYKSRYTIGAIPAFRNLTLLIDPGIYGIPNLQGKYNLLENVSFYSNFSSPTNVLTSGIIYSNSTATQYTSQLNRALAYNASAYLIPSPSIGPVTVSSFPLYFDLINNPGKTILNNMSFYDSATYPILLNLTVPNIQFGTLVLSSNSILLQPNSVGTVSLRFASDKNASGTYLVPINVIVQGKNTMSKQLDIILNIVNNSGDLKILKSMKSFNGNKNASVQLNVVNMKNSSFYNVFLYTSMNSSITSSINNFASIYSGYINSSLGNYTLGWNIRQLQGNSSFKTSYNISNVTQLRYLLFPVTVLSSTSQSNLSIISILGIVKPLTIYPNMTGNITVSAVYTGLTSKTVAFTLVAPPNINVTNPRQSFKVVPNSNINVRFTIKTGQYPGNYTFKLITPGAFAPRVQYIGLDVAPSPKNTFTFYDYLEDPRTIFGALTAAIYVSVLVYGRARKAYEARALRKRSVVQSIDNLRALDKKINVALLDGKPSRIFRRHTNKDKSLGGFVEETAVVGTDVFVASSVIIENDPILSGNARILDKARISGHAIVRGKVVISDNAKIGDDAEVYGSVKISGNAKIFGDAEVYDYAQISGNAEIFGDAHVFGEAKVSGSAKVYGSAQISGDAGVKKGNMKSGNRV